MIIHFYRYLRNTFFASSVILPVIFSSCKEENNIPEATLNVSPLSGDVPLEVRIKLSGKDLDGPNDIQEYRLSVGSWDTTAVNSIDVKRTFTSPGKVDIEGVVIDKAGAKDIVSSSVTVNSGPYIDQVVKLVNDVNIDYTAILSKISSADLTVTKGGILVFSDKITDVNSVGNDYANILTSANGITKGDYEVLLKANTLEKKSSITVPNYLPTMNLAGINGNVTEYSAIDVVLPNPTDKNPEDNNGKIISVKSLDGKTKLTLSGNSLNVRALPNYLGSYQAEIEYGSAIGGISKSILSGNILVDPRPKVNPFLQPNDSTLNWYGSGDVNKDNVLTTADRQLLMDIVNGVYSGPNDIRLLDRADVNGDGLVNVSDFNLLNNKLTGLIGYLPGYWNSLITRGERMDWLGKMMEIDKTELLPVDKTVNCVQFSNQLMINFRGFSDTDLSKFLTIYPYDVTTNGRFNIPMCEVLLSYAAGGAHMMNTVVVGDDAYVWNDLCNIEPQRNAMNVQPGQWYLDGVNSIFGARGPSISLGGGIIDMTEYFGFSIKNNVPTLYPWNYSVLLINLRGK